MKVMVLSKKIEGMDANTAYVACSSVEIVVQ